MTLLELSDLKNAASMIMKRLRSMDTRDCEEWHVHRTLSSLSFFGAGLLLHKRILVDSWPNFSCVLLCNPYDDIMEEVELFCQNEPKIIASTVVSVITWFENFEKRKIRFLSLPEYLNSQVRLHVQESCDNIDIFTDVNCVNYMRCVPFQTLAQLPDNLTFRELTPDDVSVVMGNWKYSQRIKNTAQWMTEIFQDSNRSLGVFDGDVLIGQALIHRYGLFGALFVKTEFRRRGVAKFIVQRFCNSFLEKGIYFVLQVDRENQDGEVFFRNLKMTRESESVYLILGKKQS